MQESKVEFPETLQQAITYFADEQRALDFMVSLRWANGKVTCPHCQSKAVSFLSSRKKWKCMNNECHKQFSAKVGTIFEDSALSYGKWFPAFWLIANAKNGISSYEIHRALGITQKTAWFMLHRVRLALQNGSIIKLDGEVEVDETYIGGKARNMHAAKRRERLQQRKGGSSHMTPVQGLLMRHGKGSKIVLKQLKAPKAEVLKGNVREYVLKGAEVFTDALLGYRGLQGDYEHKIIDHAECYAKGKVHTNGIENFWSLLKRGIRGTYVSVEPFHLFRYLDEQAFRFNERQDTDAGRFIKAVAGIVGRGLTFAKLTGKNEAGGGLTPA